MRTGGRQTFASPPPQLDRRRRHRPNPSSKSGGFGHDAATASAARACRTVAAPCARGPPRAAPQHDSPPPPLPPLAQRGVHRDPRPIHRDFRRDRVGIATLEHSLAFGGVLGAPGGLVVPGLRWSSPVVLFSPQSVSLKWRRGGRAPSRACATWRGLPAAPPAAMRYHELPLACPHPRRPAWRMGLPQVVTQLAHGCWQHRCHYRRDTACQHHVRRGASGRCSSTSYRW